MVLKLSVDLFENVSPSSIPSLVCYNDKNRNNLYKTLGYNYPFLNINRILPNSIVINFNFGGLKQLNDKYGQVNVDELLCLIKEILIKEIFSKSKRYRLLRTNYKNFTINVDESFLKDLQAKLENSTLTKLVHNALNNEYKSKLEERCDKNIDIDEFITDIKEYLKIGKGYSEVGDVKDFFKEKLQKFYEAEIASKISLLNFSLVFYDINQIKEILKEAFKLESEILKEYQFSLAYIKVKDNLYKFFPIVKNGHINFALVDYIRKGYSISHISHNLGKSEDKNCKSLEEKILKFYQKINAALDFIPPYISFGKEVTQINHLNRIIKSGKPIDVKYLLFTYKDVYPKKIREKLVLGKEGVMVYIDIVGLGKVNFETLYNIGKDLLDNKQVNLLNPLEKITKKFIKLVKNLKKAFGDKIAVGGDEILLFIDLPVQEFKEKLLQILEKSGFHYRFVIYKGKIQPDTIQKLDFKISELKEIQQKTNSDAYCLWTKEGEKIFFK